MTALAILAAGNSGRLGFPKQNLLYKGKTLLQTAIEAGLKSICSPVNVILGANIGAIQNSIEPYAVKILNNPAWQEGIASSVRTAVNGVLHNPEVDSLAIILCDQPFISHAVIDNLVRKYHETGKKIIASSYGHVTGVPALFTRDYFNGLLELEGHEGAKSLINYYTQDMLAIPFEQGIIDIDTISDYQRLINNV